MRHWVRAIAITAFTFLLAQIALHSLLKWGASTRDSWRTVEVWPTGLLTMMVLVAIAITFATSRSRDWIGTQNVSTAYLTIQFILGMVGIYGCALVLLPSPSPATPNDLLRLISTPEETSRKGFVVPIFFRHNSSRLSLEQKEAVRLAFEAVAACRGAVSN